MDISPGGTFWKIQKPAVHDSWNKSIRVYAGEHTKSLLT